MKMSLNSWGWLRKTAIWGVLALGAHSVALAQSIPSGAKSVKILFKDSGGSFPSTASLTTGIDPNTTLEVNGGISASTFYSTEATPSAITRPNWLTGVTVSLAGSSNAGAPNAACGGFAGSTGGTCGFGVGLSCKAPTDTYRVSEADCAGIAQGNTTTLATAGTGLKTDPVAIKIFLNRSTAYLGATENLLLVIEYQASGLMSGPTDPATCVDATTGAPKWGDPACVDQSYALFARVRDAGSPVRLKTLIPPQSGKVIDQGGGSFLYGGPVQTQQVIVPLSTLTSGENVLQISRTFGLQTPGTRNFGSYCAASATTADTPLCLGLVLYSISIFRI